MTSGTNGANTPPEDDDPFGYLYADGQANGAQPPSGGYGYPNIVNRTRPVGQRQYGQQQPQQPQQTTPYGQIPQQQGAYGQPNNAHYAAPETFPGGAPTTQHPQQGYGGGGGRGRGPNTKGLLIGAIAVVAAVVIGIGVAMLGGDGDDDAGGNQASSTPSAQQSSEPSESAGSSSAASEMKEQDIEAKALKLGPGVTTASDVQGAGSDGGIYVTGLNQTGAEVTWTVNGVPKDGVYTLFTQYSVPGKDQKMTLKVNGKVFGTKLNLGNFAKAAEGDYTKGWTETYSWPTLTKGTNTFSISCQAGDQCDVLLDQLRLKPGQVKS
ncbi:carbohydrate-binding protein [Streptomyces sp. RG80]|uniref:carbohydrate-binding protein n=1 Tax=Streptomyces sp. RG80 TaxID=3157340 RepID=UPI00338D8BF7